MIDPKNHEEEGIVRTDLSCGFCGYLLRGLKLDQACPECGSPVVESRLGEMAILGDTRWIGRVSRGISMLMIIMPGILLIPLTGLFLAIADQRGVVGMLLVSWVYVILTAMAARLIASPFPKPSRMKGSQLFRRACLIILVVFGVIGVVASIATIFAGDVRVGVTAACALIVYAFILWIGAFEHIMAVLPRPNNDVSSMIGLIFIRLLYLLGFFIMILFAIGMIDENPLLATAAVGSIQVAMLVLIGMPMADRLRSRRAILINLGRRTERFKSLGQTRVSSTLQQLEEVAASAVRRTP